MGYIKERMTAIFSQRPIRPFAFTVSGEILPYIVAIDCTGTDTTVAYNLKAKVRVIDAWAICTATGFGGTITLQDHDLNAISSAMAMATASAVARTTVINPSNQDEIKGQNLNAVKNTNTDKGWVFVVVIPISA